MKDDLIRTYVKYASERCDAPNEFHLLSAYWLVSSILGNYTKALLSHSSGGLKPNVWGIALGNSRITRKSVSTLIAKSVYNKISDNKLLPDSGSPEGFMESVSELKDGKSGIWFKDEMGGFFRALNNKPYMEGMRESMSSLYSAIGTYRKLRGSEYTIPDGLYVTALGNGPIPCHLYMSSEDFHGGFMNRFLVAYRKERDRTNPFYTGKNKYQKLKEMEDNIVELFQERKNTFIECDEEIIINIPEYIGEHLNKFEAEIEEKMLEEKDRNPDSLFSNYLGEMPTYLLKLAMLRRISRDEPPDHGMMTLSREDLANAKEDLDMFVDSGKEMIKDVEESPISKGFTTEKKALLHILSHIEKTGKEGIMWRDLMRNTHKRRNELEEYICALMDQEKIIAVRMDANSEIKIGRTIPIKFIMIKYVPEKDVVSAHFLKQMLKSK